MLDIVNEVAREDRIERKLEHELEASDYVPTEAWQALSQQFCEQMVCTLHRQVGHLLNLGFCFHLFISHLLGDIFDDQLHDPLDLLPLFRIDRLKVTHGDSSC